MFEFAEVLGICAICVRLGMLIPKLNVVKDGNEKMATTAMNTSNFDGGVLESIGVNLACWFLILITLSIGLPWAISFKQKWVTKHTIIDGKRLDFDGTGLQLFGHWLVILFFCIITLGIYGFWANIRIQRWIACHTHFAAI